MYDLHTHSCTSDGTQPVAELVAEVAARGLTGFALTDHDTTAGWEIAQVEADKHGLDFLPGMEISCSVQGISVHLLCYLHDPHNKSLCAEMERSRTARRSRAQRMVERLSKDYPLTWDTVQEHVYDDATVGRPHIADALVAIGAVNTRTEAFQRVLTPNSPYYIPHYAVDPVEAVHLVRQAGGVPVMAHPRAPSRGRLASDETIYAMIEAGLAGVEVYHRDNPPEGRQWLLELADRHNLLVTGSSDYHGTGKPNQIGENTTDSQTIAMIRSLAETR